MIMKYFVLFRGKYPLRFMQPFGMFWVANIVGGEHVTLFDSEQAARNTAGNCFPAEEITIEKVVTP